jgi:hypothetical protein
MELPACHSRRIVSPDDPNFFCAHPRVHRAGNLVYAEICRICDYWKLPAPQEFRPFPSVPRPPGSCKYFGDLLENRECLTCSGTVRIKVYACAHPRHPETTIRICSSCSDYQLDPLAPVLGREG